MFPGVGSVMVDYKIIGTLKDPSGQSPPSITVELPDGRKYTSTLASIEHLMKSNDQDARAWRKREKIDL